MTGSVRSNHRPTASWTRLRQRAELLERLRMFFRRRDFLEVDTPVLSRDTVVDVHLEPLSVTLFHDARKPTEGATFWLQTSPEFAMKRLLEAGAERIFQVTHAFRAGEVGALHNPEFTMVEWYRVGDSYTDGMDLLASLCEELLPHPTPERVTYAEAFLRHAGVDPHSATVAQLAKAARNQAVAVPDQMVAELNETAAVRDEWLNLLLACCVEPHLGQKQPTILYDYPATQAALAHVRPGPPAVAERFELYVDGIELANGYHELLDANELRTRNAAQNAVRQRDGRRVLPDTSRLLDAMDAGLPASVGVALGFDRLAMVACGATSIQEVMCFPIDRA